MVRLFLEPPKGNSESAVDNWVQNHNEWVNDPVDHSLVETTTGIDGSGTAYLRGDYRFIQDGDKTTLLDDLGARLQNFQGGLWYRVGYHACDHDEQQSTPCSWTDAQSEVRENGNIPSDIPTMV
jgi:hypothetical protein